MKRSIENIFAIRNNSDPNSKYMYHIMKSAVGCAILYPLLLKKRNPIVLR